MSLRENAVMNHRLLERLPILGCAGFIAFLFLAIVWNAAVERDWPKLRIRSAQPLAGVTAPRPAPLTLGAFVSGETRKAVSTNLGRSLPVFPISVRAKNQFLYSLFRVSGSSSVVVGQDSQLYESKYIDEFCARGAAPDQARVDAWAETIAGIESALHTQGKGFAYLVSPSKAARYPGFLPAKMNCPALARGAGDKLAPFRAALDARHVAYVDGASLISARMGDYQIDLFPRGGTHWNLLGAALALREVAPALDASGAGAKIGPFDFVWREAPEAQGDDRDLLDLSNLLWPDAHYPTAIIEGAGKGALCARAPRLVMLGGSFLREIIVVAAQAPCPPDIDYWFYMRTDNGHELVRYHNAPGDVTKGEKVPASARALRDSLDNADAVLLEENESNISTMKQLGDLREAVLAAR
jgi:hypothetical protein